MPPPPLNQPSVCVNMKLDWFPMPKMKVNSNLLTRGDYCLLYGVRWNVWGERKSDPLPSVVWQPLGGGPGSNFYFCSARQLRRKTGRHSVNYIKWLIMSLLTSRRKGRDSGARCELVMAVKLVKNHRELRKTNYSSITIHDVGTNRYPPTRI